MFPVTNAVDELTLYCNARIRNANTIGHPGKEEPPIPQELDFCSSAISKTLLVALTVGLAVTLPYFGLVTALIGASLTMGVVVIIPCICHYYSAPGSMSRAFDLLVCFLATTITAAGAAWSAADLVRHVEMGH